MGTEADSTEAAQPDHPLLTISETCIFNLSAGMTRGEKLERGKVVSMN